MSADVSTLLEAARRNEQNCRIRVNRPINLYKRTFWLVLAWLLIAALLGACASSITAKVTSFNQWPADAAGAGFSFIRPADGANDLEQQSYEKNAQLELEKFGLKRAPAGQVGRIQVDVVTGNGTRNRMYQEPIYRDNLVYHPPNRDAVGNVFNGFWASDLWGPQYVGERTAVRTLQVSNLRFRLLDSQGNAGKPKAVFESRAVYEGDIEDLPKLVPYLVQTALDGFPGKSGTVRTVKFDSKTGAVLTK